MHRRSFLTAAGLSLVAARSWAQQQEYPSRPIEFIVPAGPGGITDTLARAFGQKVHDDWGQPVIVSNRGGGGGIVASQAALAAPADGYTLTMGILSHVINPMIMSKVPYDFNKDFTPVTMMARVSNVISVHPSVPAKTLAELAALLKADPGKYAYASSGNGQSTHLGGELFKSVAGVDMMHVPYKGAAPAMADVLAGQVPILVDSTVTTAPQARAGKLRPLAVTTASRSAALPDVPTVAESGYPSYEASGWIGLIVRAGTPQPIVDKLAAEFGRITRMPDVRQRLTDAGAELASSTPQEFAAYIEAERAKWEPVIRATGVRAD